MATPPPGATPISSDMPVAPEASRRMLPPGAAAIAPTPPPPQAAPTGQPRTFMGDVQQSFEQRRSQVAGTFEDIAAGQIKPSHAATQLVGGTVAGPISDIIGAGVMAGGRQVSRNYKAAINGIGEFFPVVKDLDAGAAEAVNYGLQWLANSVPAQEAFIAARHSVDSYMKWREANPQDAKTLESIVDIASVLNPGRPGSPTFAAKTATAAERSAIKGRTGFVTDLVLPLRSRAVRLDEVSRTTQKGPLFRNVVEPSNQEREVIAEVAKLPDIATNRSAQYNYNVIRDANYRKAQDLMATLERANIPVNTQDLINKLDTDVNTMIQRTALITGDAKTVADKVKAEAIRIFSQNNGTAAGLLQARRDFDAWVRIQKGNAPFDDKLNALTSAVGQVRTSLNDYLDQIAPNANVKRSLQEQHRLYLAMDNIEEKAAEEAATLVGRLYQNIHKATGVSMVSTPMALGALAATSAGALSAGWLPYVTAPLAFGAAAGAVYKRAMSPATRQQMANLFKHIDTAMKAAGTPQLKVQLATDRAALMELMREIPVEKKEEEAQK